MAGKLQRRMATVELADGTILTDIRLIVADNVRYQETATRHRWPSMTVKNEVGTVPHLNHQDRFEIWAALTRLGLYQGKWEEFKDGDLIAYAIDEQDVNPTTPEPGNGSSVS